MDCMSKLTRSQKSRLSSTGWSNQTYGFNLWLLDWLGKCLVTFPKARDMRFEVVLHVQREARELLVSLFGRFVDKSASSTTQSCYNADVIRPRQLAESPEIATWAEINERLKDIKADLNSLNTPISIYFARHGQTTYNQRDLVSGQTNCALTSLGREQARSIAGNLQKPVDAVFSSELDRAIESAQLFLSTSRSSAEFLIDQRLNEVSMGDLEGSPRKHISAFECGNLNFSAPNGESYADAARRFGAALVDILRLCIDRGHHRILVISHNGILRIATSFFDDFESGSELFDWSISNARMIHTNAADVEVSGLWHKKT